MLSGRYLNVSAGWVKGGEHGFCGKMWGALKMTIRKIFQLSSPKRESSALPTELQQAPFPQGILLSS